MLARLDERILVVDEKVIIQMRVIFVLISFSARSENNQQQFRRFFLLTLGETAMIHRSSECVINGETCDVCEGERESYWEYFAYKNRAILTCACQKARHTATKNIRNQHASYSGHAATVNL